MIKPFYVLLACTLILLAKADPHKDMFYANGYSPVRAAISEALFRTTSNDLEMTQDLKEELALLKFQLACAILCDVNTGTIATSSIPYTWNRIKNLLKLKIKHLPLLEVVNLEAKHLLISALNYKTFAQNFAHSSSLNNQITSMLQNLAFERFNKPESPDDLPLIGRTFHKKQIGLLALFKEISDDTKKNMPAKLVIAGKIHATIAKKIEENPKITFRTRASLAYGITMFWYLCQQKLTRAILTASLYALQTFIQLYRDVIKDMSMQQYKEHPYKAKYLFAHLLEHTAWPKTTSQLFASELLTALQDQLPIAVLYKNRCDNSHIQPLAHDLMVPVYEIFTLAHLLTKLTLYLSARKHSSPAQLSLLLSYPSIISEILRSLHNHYIPEPDLENNWSS